jgi:hypothetical protein
MYELLARGFEVQADYERAMTVITRIATHPLLREFAVDVYVHAGLRHVALHQIERARVFMELADKATGESAIPDDERGFVDILRRKIEAAS